MRSGNSRTFQGLFKDFSRTFPRTFQGLFKDFSRTPRQCISGNSRTKARL
jgi:hypothetical protein